MIKRILVLTILSLIFIPVAFAAEVPGDKELNAGQDVTRPLARFDARYQYQLLAKKSSKDTFTSRADRLFPFDEKWKRGPAYYMSGS